MYLSGHKEARKTGRSVSDSGATLKALDLQSYLELPTLLLHYLLFGYSWFASPLWTSFLPMVGKKFAVSSYSFPQLSSVWDSCEASVLRTLNGKAWNNLDYTFTSWIICVARGWRTVLFSPEPQVSHPIVLMGVSCLYGTQSSFPVGNGIVHC